MRDDGTFPDDSDSFEDSGSGGEGLRGGEGSVPRRILHLVRESVLRFFEDLRPKVRQLLESPDGITRGLRVIVIGTLSLTFVIVLALLIFYRPASKSPAGSARAAGAGATSGRSTGPALGTSGAQTGPGSPGGTVLSWISTPIDVTDYLIPRTDRQALESGLSWRLSRMPKEKWSENDISRFWIDPSKLVIDHLSTRNDRLVDDLLREVP